MKIEAISSMSFGNCAELPQKVLTFSAVRLIALIVALSLVTLGITRCKTAWFDDTAYASRAVNWCQHGEAGSPIYPGAHTAKLSVYPGYAVSLGTFYKLFGIGFTQTRVFGLLCYLGLLAAGYIVFRQLGCGRIASQAAVLLLAIDPSMVWHVRAGRPDLPTAFLVAAGCAALLYALKSSSRRSGLLSGAMGGMCLAAAPIFHPYAVPAVGLVFIAFVLAAIRQSRRTWLLSAFVVGCLIPTVFYSFYVLSHWDLFREMMSSAAGFLREPSIAAPSVLDLLKEELTRRWARSFFIEPFRLVLIALGLSLVWRKSRTVTALCLTWLVTYFLILWLKVPKDTHYQIVQLALPTAVLVALVIDVVIGRRDEQSTPDNQASFELSGRARWVPALWLGSLLMGTALLSLYPLASVLQWNERSHAMLEREVARVIPSGSVVAVDASAYFASLANHCTTYYAKLRSRSAKFDLDMREVFERGLLTKYGVEYLVLDHDSLPPDLDDVPSVSLEFVSTIGMPRPPLRFVRDPEYHFDVYRVIRAESADGGRER